MNITFEGAEKQTARTHSNNSTDTTSYRSSKDTGKVSGNGFALDISGTVMDNSAYACHGRTAEEVMQDAAQQDITARRNYMAVMSNSMSDEDFAKLLEGDFHPGSTDIETVVTIVDHVKAALLQGGTQVAGYTDDLSEEKLADITGSRVFARELQEEFSRRDIPLTEENIQAVTDAWHTMEEIGELPEGAVKYLIENQLPPTVENLYLSKFSAKDDGSRQGKGYYAEGAVAGYYAKKPEAVDYLQLMPQIEKVIEEAGFSVNEDTKDSAVWLIEKGIPLNAGTLWDLQKLKGISLPEKSSDFVSAAAAAIADGTAPSKADLSRKQSCMEEALALVSRITALEEEKTKEAVAQVITQGTPFTLGNLFTAYGKSGTDYVPVLAGEGELLRARRQLEEVRLSMTVTANLKLLRSGYQIETTPIEELIDALKKAESDYAKALTQETDSRKAAEKTELYRQSLQILDDIRQAPAAVSAQISGADSLTQTAGKAAVLAAALQKAGESYEMLMTSPRKDMGDSIQKAFGNVDDILADMGRETTPENRRVIRILGYNAMEMTEENFERVRKSDELLRQVVEAMKPGRVLSMIREGVNPVSMPLQDLQEYIESRETDPAQEMESYSRFLYQLERSQDISSEERSAYIGIFRLVRQIEKNDDAAVGAVLQAGVSETLENLLAVVRSKKRKPMDYRIDDAFGGVQAKETENSSITGQIEKGYRQAKQQLEEAVAAQEMQDAGKEFDRMLFTELRSTMAAEEEVLRQLIDYGQPLNAWQLLAADEMRKGTGDLFQRIQKLTDKDGKPLSGRRNTERSGEAAKGSETEKPLSEGKTDFPEALTDRESAQSAYEALTEKLQNAIEEAAFLEEESAFSVKEMRTLFKQVGFMQSMAREENYEMPVEIGGLLVAVNLKMVHAGTGECKVAVSMETELTGKTAAEFTYGEAGLSGYSACSKAQGVQALKENSSLLADRLGAEEIRMGDIRFVESKHLDLQDFSLRVSKDREQGETPDKLYLAAKAYIGYVQEINRQKGSTEYENQF